MNLRTLLPSIAVAISMFAIGGVALAQTPEQSAPAPTPAAPSVEAASSDYILGRDDAVVVGLLGRSDYGGRARVQADGTIQLPFIGKVQAAEKTTGELAD